MQAHDGPAEFLFKLWPALEKNKNTLIGVGVAIVVIAGVWYFISTQKAQAEVDAGMALTTVMTSETGQTDPARLVGQYEEVADKYSGTAAGRRALLQAAGALFESGNYPEALTQFQKYLDNDPVGQLAATAALGIAASLEAEGKLDLAASAYQRVIQNFPTSTCVPPAQLALGRIAEEQGKFNDAMSHYQDAASSGVSGSSIAQEARMMGSDLSAKMAAAPKPAPSAKPAAAPSPAPAVPLTIPQPQPKP